jgi:hypothetical protein
MKEGKAAFGRLFFVLLNTNQRKLIAVVEQYNDAALSNLHSYRTTFGNAAVTGPR